MAGVLCVWARIDDSALSWYEDTFIPEMQQKNARRATLTEITTTGLESEPVGILDAPWPYLTVYEVPEIRKATDDCYDKRNHPPQEMLAGSLKEARFDTRTYREVKRWQAEGWDGDEEVIESMTAMEWHVTSDMHAEVLDYFMTEIAPTFAKSDGVLRLRNFQVDNATVLQRNTYNTLDRDQLLTYFTLVELDVDDWPWQDVLTLAKSEKWMKYFDTQTHVKWQLSHFLVKRTYSEELTRDKTV